MTIDTIFSRTIRPYAKEMGFKKAKQTYYRVVGDMLQTFRLKKLGYGCSVEFGLAPLCCGIINSIDIAVYDLDRFHIPISAHDYDFGSYYRVNEQGEYYKNDETLQYVSDQLCQLMKEHVFPVFEKANHSSVAFDVIVNMLAKAEECRLETLRIRNSSDHSQHSFEEYLETEQALCSIALKNYNYDFATKYFRFIIKNNTDWLEIAKDYSWYESRVPEVKERIKRNQIIIDQLENNDREAIDKMLYGIEEKSKSLIASYGWKFE